MASRDNHQTTIDQHHVIHADAHGQQVVVGLRIEGPILVPFHRASALWRFHVQLAAVGANARPDQVCHDIQNFGVAQNIVIQRMLLGGIYQTAHAGRFRCMSWLQIKDICVLSEGCTWATNSSVTRRRSATSCSERTFSTARKPFLE